MKQCQDSPNGKHEYSPDFEYDLTGGTINCEYCGDSKPKKRNNKKRKLKAKKATQPIKSLVR
jgi:hypothetical protein